MELKAWLLSEDAYGRPSGSGLSRRSFVRQSHGRCPISAAVPVRSSRGHWPKRIRRCPFSVSIQTRPRLAGCAGSPSLRNLRYETEDDPGQRYDVIIASKVLEHVDAPDQLLQYFRDRLVEGGRLVVTIPNGFGTIRDIVIRRTERRSAAVAPHQVRCAR